MFVDIAILEYIKDGAKFDLDRLYQSLAQQLTPEWIKALQHYGQTAQAGPALHVRGDWDTLDEYLTKAGSAMPRQAEKWGVAEEMTKAGRKRAYNGSVNVWDMLLLQYAGDHRYGRLFLEYYHATKGRSAMQWTPGLLAKLQISEVSDTEAIENEAEPGDTLLISLTSDAWRIILDCGAEGALLDVAASGDFEPVADFLQKLGYGIM